MTTTPKPEQPATLAEGGLIPQEIPTTPVPKGAPTDADYRREHETYYALANLNVEGHLAIAENGSVPMSHPYVPGWIADGLIARRDGEPIEGAPAAEPQGAIPGGVYPGTATA